MQRPLINLVGRMHASARIQAPASNLTHPGAAWLLGAEQLHLWHNVAQAAQRNVACARFGVTCNAAART